VRDTAKSRSVPRCADTTDMTRHSLLGLVGDRPVRLHRLDRSLLSRVPDVYGYLHVVCIAVCLRTKDYTFPGDVASGQVTRGSIVVL